MNNKKGSTLVSAMVIGMVLTILIGGCFAIASSYHTRSIKNHQERQAYLTAKAIVDTIAEEIKQENPYFIPEQVGETKNIPDIQLTNDTCESKSAKITLPQQNVFVIVASATNFGRTQTIQLTIQKTGTTWEKPIYSNEGETVYETETE
ncbi:MAG: hypothetical protein ACLUVC_12760 [Longibaculum sp.]